MSRLLLALLLTLCLASPSWAAVAFVQGKICSHVGALAAGSYSCTFAGSTTSGNAIVVNGASNAGTITAITFSDDQSGSYQTHLSQSGTPASPTYFGALGVGIAGTTATTTVTMTFTNTVQPTFYAMGIYEYSGVDHTTPTDQLAVNVQTDPGTSTDGVTSGALVTTTDGEILVSCAFLATGLTSIAGGTGFTNKTSLVTGTAIYGACEDFAQSVAGSKAMTFTAGSATNDTVTMAVSLNNTVITPLRQGGLGGAMGAILK